MSAPRLEVSGVGHAFGPLVVLDGIDLAIAPGEIVALMGESGSGKTTLGRIVAGFVAPDRGTVALDGDAVAGGATFVAPERRGVGVVPQEGALFPHLSVSANVAFGLRRGAARDERAAECLALVGLAGFGDRRPHELSGGQQQRVAVARALAPSPRLVVLDEPYSGLDASSRREVSEQVATALRAAGATALLITHDPSEAFRTADRVAVLDRGRLAQVGTPGDLYERPVELSVAMAAGTASVVPARRDGDTVHSSVATLAVDRIGHVHAGTEGILVFRPWQIEITADPAGEYTVSSVHPDVDTVRWSVRTVDAGSDDGPVDLYTVRSGADDDRWSAGDRVRVTATRAAAFLPAVAPV